MQHKNSTESMSLLYQNILKIAVSTSVKHENIWNVFVPFYVPQVNSCIAKSYASKDACQMHVWPCFKVILVINSTKMQQNYVNQCQWSSANDSKTKFNNEKRTVWSILQQSSGHAAPRRHWSGYCLDTLVWRWGCPAEASVRCKAQPWTTLAHGCHMKPRKSYWFRWQI